MGYSRKYAHLFKWRQLWILIYVSWKRAAYCSRVRRRFKGSKKRLAGGLVCQRVVAGLPCPSKAGDQSTSGCGGGPFQVESFKCRPSGQRNVASQTLIRKRGQPRNDGGRS